MFAFLFLAKEIPKFFADCDSADLIGLTMGASWKSAYRVEGSALQKYATDDEMTRTTETSNIFFYVRHISEHQTQRMRKYSL